VLFCGVWGSRSKHRFIGGAREEAKSVKHLLFAKFVADDTLA
jgi:hypothetical protein